MSAEMEEFFQSTPDIRSIRPLCNPPTPTPNIHTRMCLITSASTRRLSCDDSLDRGLESPPPTGDIPLIEYQNMDDDDRLSGQCTHLKARPRR